jgi:AcrR family transcriptional regulator
MVTNMVRAYSLGVRASRADERRQKVIEAATRLFMAGTFEEVTLQDVADAAGVALKTVVRQHGSKDALLVACAHHLASGEETSRAVAPGDLRAAARVLADRYEALTEVTLRYLAVEPRIPAVANMMALARQSHLTWLEFVFAQWLPSRKSRERSRRVAQLFGATELLVWHSWRKHLGLDRALAESALLATMEALVASFDNEGGG